MLLKYPRLKIAKEGFYVLDTFFFSSELENTPWWKRDLWRYWISSISDTQRVQVISPKVLGQRLLMSQVQRLTQMAVLYFRYIYQFCVWCAILVVWKPPTGWLFNNIYMFYKLEFHKLVWYIWCKIFHWIWHQLVLSQEPLMYMCIVKEKAELLDSLKIIFNDVNFSVVM